MKKNNKLFFVLLTAALILSLVSCPDGFVGDGDMVTISINLGSRSVLTAWPPSPEIQKELEYVITFTNTSGEKVTARSKGSSTIKVKIQPGIWDIDIDAIYKGTLYATGSVSDYEIIAGQVNTVTTTMERILWAVLTFENITFNSAAVGYSDTPTTNVVITNNGTAPATISSITTNRPDLFTPSTLAGVTNGGTGTFTVQAANGLPIGTYSAQITVTYNRGNESVVSVTRNISFNVTNLPSGQPVDKPVANIATSATTFTINAVTPPSGQTVEYAISASGTVTNFASLTWVTGTDFTVVGSPCYVYARSAAVPGLFTAGTPNVSDPINIYAVSFDLDGGSSPIPAPQYIIVGGTATAPATPPTRTAVAGLYLGDIATPPTPAFNHWSISQGGTAYNFDTPVTNNRTLIAVWNIPNRIATVTPNNITGAINYVNTNAETYTLFLDGSVNITASVSILDGIGRKLTILGLDSERTIFFQGNSPTSLFRIIFGAELTIGNNITLNGSSYTGIGAAAQPSDGGTFIMTGSSKITGFNAAAQVYLSTGGIFKMENGTISGELGGSRGVYMIDNGGCVFNMTGGRISGHVLTGSGSQGSGVYVGQGNTFTKTNGIIYGNDGSVNENTAEQGGHAVFWAEGNRTRNTTSYDVDQMTTEPISGWDDP